MFRTATTACQRRTSSPHTRNRPCSKPMHDPLAGSFNAGAVVRNSEMGWGAGSALLE